jgi:predicted RNA-binding Zn-ribbon protein involved in translation (DUF1610 family)
MKLVCPSCGHHDIFTEQMLSGVFMVKRGKEVQLEAWYCHDCGFQGIHADFEPGSRRWVIVPPS